MKNPQRPLFRPPPPTPRPAKPPPETWTVEFVPCGAGPAGVLRIRRILKLAWRSYGLRARLIDGPIDPPRPTDAIAGENSPSAAENDDPPGENDEPPDF